MTIRVVLVDDHELIRQGLRRSFDRHDDFVVVGEAGSVAEASELVSTTAPDVVVMDVRLPDGSGLEATRSLRARFPDLGILVLTMYDDQRHLLEALEVGASAFVAKKAPASDVLAAARIAAASPRSFTAAGLPDAVRERDAGAARRLTTREAQVLQLLAEGLSVAGVAKQLFVSESTAKTHIAKVYEKLGASNRAQALMAALKAGLLEDPGHL